MDLAMEHIERMEMEQVPVGRWVAPWGLFGAQNGSSRHEAGSRSVEPSLS
jgi:hypothetical protein